MEEPQDKRPAVSSEDGITWKLKTPSEADGISLKWKTPVKPRSTEDGPGSPPKRPKKFAPDKNRVPYKVSYSDLLIITYFKMGHATLYNYIYIDLGTVKRCSRCSSKSRI